MFCETIADSNVSVRIYNIRTYVNFIVQMGTCGNTGIPDITNYFPLLNTLTDINIKTKHVRVTCVITVLVPDNYIIAEVMGVFGSHYLSVSGRQNHIARAVGGNINSLVNIILSAYRVNILTEEH